LAPAGNQEEDRVKLTIKAIPNVYKGVNFRSRLEARWAAFFDLNRWQWDYEPIDIDGWCPDFQITTPWCHVFAEVKPVLPDLPEPPVPRWVFDKNTSDEEFYKRLAEPPPPRQSMSDDPSFAKAFKHWQDVQVLLLGTGPERDKIGCLLDPPPTATYHWSSVHNFLDSWNIEAFWREAGNVVQWNAQSH
jgi:hypothetical protein